MPNTARRMSIYYNQPEKYFLGWLVRLVHSDVEDCSEELLHQQSYAIKNQLVTSKALWGFRTENTPY